MECVGNANIKSEIMILGCLHRRFWQQGDEGRQAPSGKVGKRSIDEKISTEGRNKAQDREFRQYPELGDSNLN
jgi:hypothetical protein